MDSTVDIACSGDDRRAGFDGDCNHKAGVIADAEGIADHQGIGRVGRRGCDWVWSSGVVQTGAGRPGIDVAGGVIAIKGNPESDAIDLVGRRQKGRAGFDANCNGVVFGAFVYVDERQLELGVTVRSGNRIRDRKSVV